MTVHPTMRVSYTHGDLDRAVAHRKNPDWIRTMLGADATLLAPVWNDRNFFEPASRKVVIGGAQLRERILATSSETVFLGLRDGAAIFAVDMSGCEESEAAAIVGTGGFVDLRKAVTAASDADASLMAYARSIMLWHRSCRFCGRCGHATESRAGGHVRVCLNGDCSREWFPVTSPAVIMLVERRGEDGRRECLLARHGRLGRGVYTTLAGFVDQGESLEQAVAREVLEEAGIRVGRVRYQASQPWPFPSSLMIGFYAEAETFDLTIDHDELDDARWFSADEVSLFGNWEDEDAEFRLPRKDSIARTLVDTWLAEQARRAG